MYQKYVITNYRGQKGVERLIVTVTMSNSNSVVTIHSLEYADFKNMKTIICSPWSLSSATSSLLELEQKYGTYSLLELDPNQGGPQTCLSKTYPQKGIYSIWASGIHTWGYSLVLGSCRTVLGSSLCHVWRETWALEGGFMYTEHDPLHPKPNPNHAQL